MLSWNCAPLPLNGAYVSAPFAGHAIIPDTAPWVGAEFGPSTAAPASIGEPPVSEPARLATWCCRHFGYVEPSPTMNDRPHAFAPRMFASQRSAYTAYVFVPDSWSYSLACTDNPAPCVVVSHAAQVNPNPKGSVFDCATALS